jgi:hypothetical protein
MKSFKLFFASLFIIISVSFFSGCSQDTGQIVCDYGTILCDVSKTLCTQIPGVPDEVCTYLDLACYNLDQLCLLRDSTDNVKYQVALTNLQNITYKLKEWKSKQVTK